VPSGVFDLRGADSYLKVRRAPGSEKKPLDAVHRWTEQKAGEKCGLAVNAEGSESGTLRLRWFYHEIGPRAHSLRSRPRQHPGARPREFSTPDVHGRVVAVALKPTPELSKGRRRSAGGRGS